MIWGLGKAFKKLSAENWKEKSWLDLPRSIGNHIEQWPRGIFGEALKIDNNII